MGEIWDPWTIVEHLGYTVVYQGFLVVDYRTRG